MLIKRGKREERGMTPTAARTKMKRTLLFTYFMTLASLVLCCAMFLGTTMAWFTSDVTNSGNVIQVGSLSAKIFRVEDNEQLDLSSASTPAFVFSQAWQPKNAAAETFKVVNQGDLEFTYELDILVKPGTAVDENGAELSSENLAKLLSGFEVYVVVGKADAASLKSYVENTVTEANAPQWAAVKLDEQNQPVSLLAVTTEPAEGSEAADIVVWSGELDPKQEGETESAQQFTVGIYMKENVTAEVMKWNVELIVQLTANQKT